MKKDKKKYIKWLVIAAVSIGVIGFIAVRQANQGAPAFSTQDFNTVTLQKTALQNSLSISGQVASDNVVNIYSSLNAYPMQEVFAEVGDRVQKGDILARIDITNLQYDIEQAQNNLENAQKSLRTEMQNNANSVTNAQNSLSSSIISRDRQQLAYEKSLSDLAEAEKNNIEPFDSYTYDNAIIDAKRNLGRKLEDLSDAQSDLTEAIEDFDDYTYQNAITEAKASLDKRKKDLQDAEETLQKQLDSFDAYTYQNAIDNAKLNLDRRKEDLSKAEEEKNDGVYFNSFSYEVAINTAQLNLDSAQRAYNDALAAAAGDVTNPTVIAAQKALEAAQVALDKAYNNLGMAQASFYSNQQPTLDAAESKVKAAQTAVDDAKTAYDKAVTDLARAKDKAVEDAEKVVTSAKTAVNDAQRAYDKALTDLDRAKTDAPKNMQTKVDTAQKAADDAQRTYDKAITDLARAQDDYAENVEKQLENAKRSVADAQKSLEAAKLSVTSAQNSLSQAKAKTLSGEASVSNQQITLNKLMDQLAKSDITATETGTITVVNAVSGMNPNGVLFTLEDTELLYVKANVKEYNLKDIYIGQKVMITTDATDGKLFEGEIIYISSKAVSAAGSTNVEFEIHVSISDPSANIKIGMNAFLEIILESKSDVYVVPLSALITNENGTCIQVLDGAQTTEIPVTVGIKTTTMAEIFGDNLADGLVVVTGTSASPSTQRGGMMFGGANGN